MPIYIITNLLAAGVNVKVVSERLGHASVAFTMDTYAHVMPGMQESAAEQLDRLILPEILGTKNVVRMLSNGCQNVVKEGVVEREPRRTRTSNRLIKSDEPLMIGEAREGDLASSGKVMNLGYYLIYYLVPAGIVKFVGKMLAKILLLIELVNRRNTEIQ